MAANNTDIIRWDKKYRSDFIRLNREWIERYFRLEPCDVRILGNPEAEILEKGGEIFFAVCEGQAVGTCALICHPENNRYELAKMAVSPAAQGQGLGYRLGRALVEFARMKGVDRLFLEANTKLEASIRLYRKLGFQPIEEEHPAYSRCNLFMELAL